MLDWFYMFRQQSAPGFPWRGIGSTVLVLLSILLSVPGVTAASLEIRTLDADASGAEIQQALNGLAGGGEVRLAGGTYRIHEPIILQHDYQALSGIGRGTILRLDDNANCPVVILGAPGAVRSVGHLRLADLFIDGNRTHQRVEFWRAAADGSEINNNGIEVRAATDAMIERVVACHCRSGGLVTSAGTRRLTVREFCSFDNQFDGLACYLTEDSRFSGLFLHDNLAAGMSFDLSFDHNVIDQAVLSDNDLGIFMRDSHDNQFSELTIRGSRRHGVFMAQTLAPTKAGWRPAPGTECTGNRFGGVEISECAGKAFLVNDASCTNNLYLPLDADTRVAAPKLLDVRNFAPRDYAASGTSPLQDGHGVGRQTHSAMADLDSRR